MDDTGDDSRYGFGSSNRKKIPFRENSYPRPVVSQYSDEEDEEEEEEEDEDEDDEEEEEQEDGEVGEDFGDEEDDHNNKNGLSNGYPIVREDAIDLDDDSESESDEESDGGGENRSDGPDSTRHPRKRKLKSLISSYEFAPRVPPAGPAKPPPPPPPSRNSLTDWTEQETVALLDSWGDRYLRRGGKSLRSEEWREVAEKVSEVSESDRTETQCRNRLDTLKKKYKKEKLGPSGSGSRWAYFKKMDLLLSATPPVPPRQHQRNPKPGPQNPGLSCGLDSGEYVFMNPRVYLNRANGLDEMRDSPGNSESDDDDDDGGGSDGLPPKKRKKYVDEEGSCSSSSSSSSFRLIANSIKKFSEVYEKIEASKRQQMVEIEKMRMDFQRDLEAQKRQIMERAQSEIAKIRRGDDDDDDDDDDEAENGSG